MPEQRRGGYLAEMVLAAMAGHYSALNIVVICLAQDDAL